MNVSYKIIVSNHYADNGKLREEILQKAVNKEREPLAREYHQMIEERLQEGRGGLLQAVKDNEFPNLPRLGLRMFLDKKLGDATYFGMGPQESYRDKHQASSHLVDDTLLGL